MIQLHTRGICVNIGRVEEAHEGRHRLRREAAAVNNTSAEKVVGGSRCINMVGCELDGQTIETSGMFSAVAACSSIERGYMSQR